MNTEMFHILSSMVRTEIKIADVIASQKTIWRHAERIESLGSFKHGTASNLKKTAAKSRNGNTAADLKRTGIGSRK